MRLAALATGLILLALAGIPGRALVPEVLLPGPFEALGTARFDRSGITRKLQAGAESITADTRTAALGDSGDLQVSK